MKDDSERQAGLDEELARRFAAMRRQDSDRAPAFRTAEPSSPPAGPAMSLRRAGGGVAALAALLLVAVLYNPQQPSPDGLYLEVMAGSTLLTDDLMETSVGLSPENMLDESFFDEALLEDAGPGLYRQLN